ncbi:hypothetical protein C8R44DRAFT_732755 [Mycena epipterygia]|nr:hypothetical protein C8R44DRAFT_732755 [Mycena epipterygia]
MAVPLHGKCDFTCKNARVISCRAWEHHPELHASILYEERRDPSSWDPINVLNFHRRSTTDESLNKADDSKTLASRQALAQSGLKGEAGGTISNGTQHHTQQKTGCDGDTVDSDEAPWYLRLTVVPPLHDGLFPITEIHGDGRAAQSDGNVEAAEIETEESRDAGDRIAVGRLHAGAALQGGRAHDEHRDDNDGEFREHICLNTVEFTERVVWSSGVGRQGTTGKRRGRGNCIEFVLFGLLRATGKGLQHYATPQKDQGRDCNEMVKGN